MKKLFTYLISKNKFLERLIYERGLFVKIKLSTLISNILLNFLSRHNTDYSLTANYKTTIVAGKNLNLLGTQKGTYSSLVNSPGCYIQAGNSIYIDEGTIWSANVAIISANHNMEEKEKSWLKAEPIRIGKDCWIGANACILPGVVLGDNVVVGAGSVVTRSFLVKGSVVAGNPARIITKKE
tara:strand:+ start:1172 stop:1717 length:546 start_codon:yes stop_codon:yes gene_type:complete